MRNLLAFFAGVCLTFVSVGWYLDWYTIETSPAGSGHRNVSIDFNTTKISTDIQHGSARLQGWLARQTDAVKESAAATEKVKIDPKKDAEKEAKPTLRTFGGGENSEAH
jgi:hypothetical protein